MTDEPAGPKSVRSVLLGVLLDIGPPLGVDAVRARRLDPFAGYLMLNFGLSLAVGLVTSDARMLMVGDTLVGGIGALIFLGSCVVGTPLTQVLAERVHSAPEPGEQDFTRRMHILLSAMWGVGLLFGMLVSLAIIFSLSVDVGKGVNTVVSLALTGLLVLATAVVAKKAKSRREQSITPLS